MQSALVTTNRCQLLTYMTLGSQIIDCWAGNQAYIVHHRSTRLQRGECGDILMKKCFDQAFQNLRASVLCNNQYWTQLDNIGLVTLYNDILESLLNTQIPVTKTTCRQRPSNAWFNDDCRKAKQSLRTLEREARKAGPQPTHPTGIPTGPTRGPPGVP